MLMCNLDNCKKVLASAIEVSSFPNADLIGIDRVKALANIQSVFSNLFTEFYKYSEPDLTSLEMIWLGEPVQNQGFHSKLRVFFIIRRIGQELNNLKKDVDLIQNNLISLLNQLKMEVFVVEDTCVLSDLLGTVDYCCHYSVVKAEGIFRSAVSFDAYYTWSTLNIKSGESLAALLSKMSAQERFAVSFQIIPTSYTQEEQNCLSAVKSMIHQNSGNMDETEKQALNSWQFVENHFQQPVFYYDISVFGNRDVCREIAIKLNSLLSSGEQIVSKNDLLPLDLSSERIRLNDQFFVYPWIINRLLLNKYRNPSLVRFPVVKQLGRLPYIMTVEELLVYYRLPLYEKETPFIREKRSNKDIEHFSDKILGDDTIKLGVLELDDGTGIQIGVPMKTWTQHALVVGKPGTGKTTFSVNILTQFAKKDIPFLAIEPTKKEYRAMIDAVPDLQIFTPGNNSVSPFIINPFIPPVGVTAEQYIPSLMSAFRAAFSMDGPLEMLFMKSINACYTEYGWRLNSKSGDPETKPFGLYEYILCFKRVMQTMNYNREVQSNLETAGLLRLMNLIEQNPNIYDSYHTVPIEDLLQKPTVIELNAIANEEQKSLLMALLLSGVYVYTINVQKGDGKLKNVLLIDEAHVLLDAGADNENAGQSKNSTVRSIQKMIAELRSYGTSIIIADQSPSAVTERVVANTNVKVIFRLTAPKDRELIAESADMSEENASFIPKLEVGQAFVHFEELTQPHMIQTEDTRKRDGIRLVVEDEEICARMHYWDDKRDRLVPYLECSCSPYCRNCSFVCRNNAEYYASLFFNIIQGKINDTEKLYSYLLKGLPKFLENNGLRCVTDEERQLRNCIAIKTVRKARLVCPVTVPPAKIQGILERLEKGEVNNV